MKEKDSYEEFLKDLIDGALAPDDKTLDKIADGIVDRLMGDREPCPRCGRFHCVCETPRKQK
jgi:hypothetical protein